MTHPKDNAFPCDYVQAGVETDGLNKLEYFAALAMQGFIASYAIEGAGDPKPAHVAKKAVEYAKALIQELDNE